MLLRLSHTMFDGPTEKNIPYQDGITEICLGVSAKPTSSCELVGTRRMTQLK